MAFLKTSKLKALSRKASNKAAIDQARAKSKTAAKSKTKASQTSSSLKDVWDKMESSKVKSPDVKSASKAEALSAESPRVDTPSNDKKLSFVADNMKNYKAPEFRATLGDSKDNHDVTTERPHPNSQKDDAFDLGMQPVVPREGRADVSAMRLDVARITADIQSGEELYRRAQQRINSLTTFVERADVDFSLLNRLEPENRRLKARNRTIESELDDKQRKLSILQIDLEDHRKRLEERNAGYEAAQSKLSVAGKTLRTYENTLSTIQQKLDKSDLSQERMQTALHVERRENESLRERVIDLSADLAEKQSHYLEVKKMSDSLLQDCNDFRQSADTAHKANVDFRNALDNAQKQNNAMKGEMISLHEDIRTFKTQYEFNVISREDEITAMQNQVATLKKQLEVKDEIVRNAARDITELRKIRTAQDLERERLEAQIQSQSFQLDEVSSELVQSKQDVSDFDRRYRDVATALSVTQARRAGNAPSEAPDIRPRSDDSIVPVLAAIPTAQNLQDIDTQADALTGSYSSADDDLSDDDIINRITEFKLGLRKDIG